MEGAGASIGEDGAFPTAIYAAANEEVEQLEVLNRLRRAVEEVLTERQRAVFVAVALNDVPIDIVAARFGTTRGAIYKALHDARRKLRAELELQAGASRISGS